ncbi:divalent-cation tolerance protein CutA [Botrimarina sp.]|uniref:divalent-cation tolerance protein CutA n=1 Tax=Botrimarina sp. TaxID=2795802 RepID=UPI0032ECC7AF
MLLVSTTTDSEAAAMRLAKELVERRLAACVQVMGPIKSVYRWQERVETADEWLCTAKTLRVRWDAVRRLIEELHPYDTPEVVAVPIESASAAYGRWLAEQCDGADAG